jgi:peptidoglycan glycosyltransferase
MAAAIALLAIPGLVERIRRLSVPISLVGLALAFATALLGSADESGARLALKLGPLPAIQTSEMIKVSLIIFLAWFIEREGAEAEGRAYPILSIFRVPALRHFIPGLLFVALATLALVQMSDFGAVLILGLIFVLMLFAGFESRLFATIAAIGLALSILAGLVLSLTWQMPAVIQTRWQAYLNPWSEAPVLVDGQPTGLTIAEGPGYQVQQSVYATVAGGLTGAGLGFGSPEYIPLGASDFIFASLLEEMGAMVGLLALAFYAILLLRILRVAARLPREQVFERLLVTGIAVHLFTQVFVIVGGTLNLIPLTGVTVPFMSLGGASLMVNLVEIGLVLAISRRVEALP